MQDLKTAKDDLAFLRSLTQDSRPLLRSAGAVLVIGGVVHALSALRFFAIEQAWIGWPPPLRPYMGVDAAAVQIVVMFLLGRETVGRARLLPGSINPAARAIRGAVNALAVALAVAFAALLVASSRSIGGDLMRTAFPIILFALAGATWQIAWAVYRRFWTIWATLGSAFIALGIALTAGLTVQSLVLAIGLLLCIAVPGVAMMRLSDPG